MPLMPRALQTSHGPQPAAVNIAAGTFVLKVDGFTPAFLSFSFNLSHLGGRFSLRHHALMLLLYFLLV